MRRRETSRAAGRSRTGEGKREGVGGQEGGRLVAG